MMQVLGEIDRRLANLLRYGTIAALDAANARVTVNLDDCTTDWLPWFAARAGGDRSWWAPEVGEQVMVLSPSGELSHGCVLPAIFQDAHPANGNSKDLHRVTFSDGTVVTYDRAGHALTVDASASNGSVTVNTGTGNVTVNCNQATVHAVSSVTLDTPVTNCTGNLNVTGLTTTGGLTSLGTAGGGGATITGNVTVTGATTLNGNVGTTGTLTNNGKAVGSTHAHGGVQTGGGTSGAPT